MRKTASKKRSKNENEVRAQYDFARGERGKHYRAMRAGYTITIHRADGSKVVKEIRLTEGAVLLEPDVRKYFPDSESVNDTLRALISLVPQKRRSRSRPQDQQRG